MPGCWFFEGAPQRIWRVLEWSLSLDVVLEGRQNVARSGGWESGGVAEKLIVHGEGGGGGWPGGLRA